jgi:CheY-like chemotaxis protein
VVSSKILVVDDSEELLFLFKSILESGLGCEVRTALRGTEALNVIRDWRPELVLTDLIMPEMNGLELITRIRSDFAPPLPAIVAMSGFPDLEVDAQRRGASSFHLKPILAEDLLALVSAALAAVPVSPRLRERAIERRAEVGRGADAALALAIANHPDLLDRVRLATTIVSRYFGGVLAVALFLREGKLRVLACSDPSFPEGMDLTEGLHVLADVVESGTTLVVSDLRMIPALRARSGTLTFRLLVSVPLRTLNGAAVGSLSIMDREPRLFDTTDLNIVEEATRWATRLLAGDRERVAFTERSFFKKRAWAKWLLEEFAHVQAGRSLGVAMIDLPVRRIAREQVVALWQEMPTRAVIAELGERTLAAYKIAADAQEAERALETLLGRLRAIERVGAAAIVTFAELDLPNHPDAVMHIVEGVLETARRHAPGTVLRMSVVPRLACIEATP